MVKIFVDNITILDGQVIVSGIRADDNFGLCGIVESAQYQTSYGRTINLETPKYLYVDGDSPAEGRQRYFYDGNIWVVEDNVRETYYDIATNRVEFLCSSNDEIGAAPFFVSDCGMASHSIVICRVTLQPRTHIEFGDFLAGIVAYRPLLLDYDREGNAKHMPTSVQGVGMMADRLIGVGDTIPVELLDSQARTIFGALKLVKQLASRSSKGTSFNCELHLSDRIVAIKDQSALKRRTRYQKDGEEISLVTSVGIIDSIESIDAV